MVRNYGDPQPMSAQPLPALWNRTVANNAAPVWHDAQYQPDAGTCAVCTVVRAEQGDAAVIINLGTNDYSTQPHPSDDEFIGGYVDFVARARTAYPAAQFFALCGPMTGNPVRVLCVCIGVVLSAWCDLRSAAQTCKRQWPRSRRPAHGSRTSV
jgi:hypothetical protein